MKRSHRIIIFLVLLLTWMTMVACLSSVPTAKTNVEQPQPTSTPEIVRKAQIDLNDTSGGPIKVSGTFTYTNDFITEVYYDEHTVVLFDLTGFVQRDDERIVPVEAQVLGYSEIDEATNSGKYFMDLPARPNGAFNDVDQSGTYNKGVQIFAIDYNPNLAGSPYGVDADALFGWPTYLASIKTDSENNYEITGGKIMIWAETNNESFPIGFGDDGLLFTADDPVQKIPSGYSLVDLDQTPFVFTRTEEVKMDLYEAADLAVKDFSAEGYSKAFTDMFETVRKEYAFNGIEGKQPDYDAVYAEIYPRIVDAESTHDWDAYFSALFDFTLAFHDGHVGIDGGDDGEMIRFADIVFGYGLSVKELDNGDVVVIYVSPGSSAQKAGMAVGNKILEIDGVPVTQAISNVNSVFGPYSTDFAKRNDQINLLFRTGFYQKPVQVKFKTANGSTFSQTLLSEIDESSYYESFSLMFDDPAELPVVFSILDNHVGYLRLNSNYDDLNFGYRLLERALYAFEVHEVTGIIIDMRENSGGLPVGIAGFLTDEDIPLAKLEYYNNETGKFEAASGMETINAMPIDYHFEKMVTLIGPDCYSACEIDAYGLSQVPGMEVIGFFPTAGVEADIARGQFQLPEGITLYIPTGRFSQEDGSLFLEGQGVQPTVRVPLDENTVFAQDAVLKIAMTYMNN